MTFDERTARLVTAYGWTPRQARFATLTALIGGYCLRRQYGRFAGIALGKNPAAFLDDLVRRGLATRARPRLHRSYVYRIHHKSLYRALGMIDNRHRRPALIPSQARRVMMLDFAISQPDATWYATEDDKVRFFASLGIPLTVLPGRVYRSNRRPQTTLRRFVFKSPIYQLPNERKVHFAYLSLDTTGDGLATFLDDHAPLIRSLQAWNLSVVFPAYLRSAQPAWHTVLARTHFLGVPALSRTDALELHAYFKVQHALRHAAADSPVTIDQAYERRRRRFEHSPHQALYEHWRANDGPRRPPDAPPAFDAWRPTGSVSTHELPYSYDLFGSFPGVA